MSMGTQRDVHAFEAEIIDLAQRIMSARCDVNNRIHDDSVTRSDLGTLHVNLLGLARRADELATALEKMHGFVRDAKRGGR